MHKITKIAISLTACLLISVPAYAQAFGIAMGTPISELDIVNDIGKGYYIVTVPTPHSEFESYLAYATTGSGTCLVKGLGKDHDNDKYGLSVSRSFDSLATPLTQKYGSHFDGDFLRDGALWDGPDEWVMAIYKNERVRQYAWDRDEKSTLPESLNAVILYVSASGLDTSYVVLQYTFSNVGQCDSEIEASESTGL